MQKKLSLLLLVLTLCAAVAVAEDAPSDNWLEYPVVVGDIAGNLPMPASTFLDAGWTMEDPEDTLKPDQYAFSRRLSNGDAFVYVQVINLGIDELPVTECLIGAISLDDYDAKKGGTLSVAGGITLGDTREEVEAVFGTPGDVYEGSSSTTYTYESDSYCHTKFTFDLETDVVTKVDIRNFTTPEGYNDEALAAPAEVPQEITAYKAPTALGDDLFSFTVRVGDTLYTVPAAFPYMAENGWQFGQKQEGKVAAWSYQRRVPVLLGGYKMDTQLYNGSPKATSPENCFVTTFRFDGSSKLDVELPHGITFGMSRADLIAALDAQAHAYEENEYSSFYSYVIKQDILQEITINVDAEKDEVNMIELTCQP